MFYHVILELFYIVLPMVYAGFVGTNSDAKLGSQPLLTI